MYFVTGTDEHGQKIQEKAKETNNGTKGICRQNRKGHKNPLEYVRVDYDEFIRTTDVKHEKAVQSIFNQLHEQGDIYKSNMKDYIVHPVNPFG